MTDLEDVYSLLKKHYNESEMEQKEFFKMILLNEDAELIKVSDVAEGDNVSCDVNSWLMFKEIFANDTKGIIISHNHCGKNLTPSQSDIIQTRNTQRVCEYLGIKFLGHIIVNLGGYYFMYPEQED